MNTYTNTSGAKTGILSLIAALILLAVIVFPGISSPAERAGRVGNGNWRDG